MAKRSFIEQINVNRPRSRSVAWPLDPNGPERIDVRMMSDDDLERAHFATLEHFKTVKRKVDVGDVAYRNRHRVEVVYRAISHDGEPIASSADELAAQPAEVIDALWATWGEFQREAAVLPPGPGDIDRLIEELKKNIPEGALAAFPSSWLIAVITTLVGPSSSSPTTNGSG